MSKLKKFKEYSTNNKSKKIEDKELHNIKRSYKNNLADDITSFDKDMLDRIVKLADNEYEIVSVNDVSLENPKNISEATIINAELSGEVKRGDNLYITAMIKKKNATINSMCVIKVRIVDMFQGLSYLNTLK